MFRIGRNTFFDRKSKIPMKILELKRSGIGLIMEFCGIPNIFPNQGDRCPINKTFLWQNSSQVIPIPLFVTSNHFNFQILETLHRCQPKLNLPLNIWFCLI